MVDLDKVKTILVTGGSGFIGSYVVNHLLEKYPHIAVVNVDSHTYAADESRIKATDKYTWEDVDITKFWDLLRVFISYVPDAVIHLAAESHVDRSIFSSKKFIDTNVGGTGNVLDVILEMKRQGSEIPLLHVSTDEIYGEAEGTREFVESDPAKPRNPYSASKAAAEHLVRAYVSTHGLRAVVSRGANTYGVGQNGEKLIPATVTRLLQSAPADVYGSGENVREWLHAQDHAEGLILCLSRGAAGETYNIGTGVRTTNNVVVDQIISAGLSLDLFSDPTKAYVVDRLGHDSRYAMDSSAVAKLGFVPHYLGTVERPLDEETLKEIIRSLV